MYIYAFGSVCRGEVDKYSDIDLLAIIEKNEKNESTFDAQKYSIYKEERIIELWNEGNPFAWHLFLESKLIYSDNKNDLLKKIGKPNEYLNVTKDLDKFYSLYKDSLRSLNETKSSYIFDLSMIFLAIRNFASCYSLGYLNDYQFSRKTAINLKNNKLKISNESFSILERARVLSTRGVGKLITDDEMKIVMSEIEIITSWFDLIKNTI